MKHLSTSSLLKQRIKLSRFMEEFQPLVIRGSLIERYKRCGKLGCKCMSGKGHGPKYYLTLSVYKGKQDAIYVPLSQVEKVKKHLERFHTISAALKKIGDINRELLRRGDTTY